MTANCAPWRILAAAATVAVAATWLSAGDPARPAPADSSAAALPAPADLANLSVHPAEITLKGADDAAQIIVTGQLAGDKVIDLTGSVVYSPADGNLVAVSAAGRVTPRTDGRTEITVQYGDRSVKVPVAVSHTRENLPINFANQIVPVFTKLGCNSGGCHGKASGQNGFKLSLLGFEPEIDYASLVKEGRGRRTFPAAPDNSLLLLKATGQLPHGGGKKMEVDSDEYRLVRRWIASGLPLGKPDDPVVTRLSVFPDRRVMARGSRQQIAVYAHYSDGSVEDITRRAQFESNDIDIASVDAAGLVQTHSASGEAAIMVRYQGHVSVYRATVPLGLKVPEYQFPAKTLVDNFTLAKYRLLGLVPSDLCTDEEFIRRASIDICGTLPTPEEITAFVANADPNKRDKLVDELLERPEYGYYFANKWSAILRNKRRGQPQRAQGTFAFHAWIRDAIQQDMPYDRFVREIIAATGDEHSHPPVVWYREIANPQQFVDDMAQLFLGQRLACAQCHHHPYEKWSQDDYWGLAAFYGRVGRKQINDPGGIVGQQNVVTRIFVRNSGNVNNERTRQPARIKPLDAEPIDVPAGDDPRQKLVDWMVDPGNPFFAKALVNRYWAHFFGRGIVHEPDDMRVTNPPSNEELLDALARDFIAKKFSLKELVRTIAKSRTYQLSSVPNDFNKFDRQNFARFYPRPLNAEVLLDAISQATDSPTLFNGLPQDAHAPKRAIMLPDDGFTTYFLEVFGKPQGNSACECERVNEANLAQALHLLNSDEIQNKLARPDGRCDRLAKDAARPDKDKVEELFLWTFGRKPSEQEVAAALAHIDKLGPQRKKTAYENILWALINAKEFRFND